MSDLPRIFRFINRTSLVAQIVVGLLAGALLALFLPGAAKSVALLGDLFVQALKAVAPVLVFVLVTSSLANHKRGQPTHIRPIILLYAVGTLSAAAVAVLASFMFPTSLTLVSGAADVTPPSGVGAVLQTLLFNIADNPVRALLNGNFIGILAWAIGLGFAFRHAQDSTRRLIGDLSDGVTLIVKVVIRFAPLGVFGLVAGTLADSGFDVLLGYARLLLVLVGAMLFMALVMNPLIVFWQIRRNPYPLVFTLLARERHNGLLHPQFGRQHPGEHATVSASRAAQGHLLGFHPAGRDYQHGWCGDHHHGADPGCGQYAWHPGGCGHRGVAEPAGGGLRLRCLGCGRWLVTADSAGLQSVWHLQRPGDAGRGGRLHHRCGAGLGRDGAEFLD